MGAAPAATGGNQMPGKFDGTDGRARCANAVLQTRRWSVKKKSAHDCAVFRSQFLSLIHEFFMA